jgi:hypothetical protein
MVFHIQRECSVGLMFLFGVLTMQAPFRMTNFLSREMNDDV